MNIWFCGGLVVINENANCWVSRCWGHWLVCRRATEGSGGEYKTGRIISRRRRCLGVRGIEKSQGTQKVEVAFRRPKIPDNELEWDSIFSEEVSKYIGRLP